jgi:hypothetical protein
MFLFLIKIQQQIFETAESIKLNRMLDFHLIYVTRPSYKKPDIAQMRTVT